MSMIFETIRDAVIQVLGDDAAGRYRVVGYQSQGSGANEFKGNDRAVIVYYYRGQFPKSKGSIAGPNDHDINFRLEFRVAGKAIGSAADPTAITRADLDADRSLDELFGIIYQVLMNPKNEAMGLTKGIVQERWVGEFQKDDLAERGESPFLSGYSSLSCTCKEAVITQAGTPGTEYTVEVDLDGDDVEKTKVAGTLGG